MERSLLWGAFGIGIAGWLSALLLSRRDPQSEDSPPLTRTNLLIAAALIVMVQLATMPSSPPFARGQGLGMGFLFGGAAALISAWSLSLSSSGTQSLRQSLLQTAPFFLAIPATVIPLLFMRSNIIDALLGVAIGSLAVTTLLSILQSGQTTRRPSDLLPGTAFTATLTATAALGIYRGATVYSEWKWGATAALIAASIPFLMLLTAIPSGALASIAMRFPLSGLLARAGGAILTTEQARDSGVRFLRILIGSVLILGLSYLLSIKVVLQPAVLYVVLVGIAASVVAAWLIRDAENPENLNARTSERLNSEYIDPNAILSVLVILAGIMVSYHLLAGFGVGLAVLSGWLIAGIAQTSDSGSEPGQLARSQVLAYSLCFGTVFVVYRLAIERFREDLRGVQFTDHYALFGFVFGLFLPGLLARLAKPDSSLLGSLASAIIAGILTLAAPAGLLLVWGQKTLLAFLFGLALAATTAISPSGPQRQRTRAISSLLAIGLALAVAQWSHLALPLAALPRSEKLRILAWAVGVLAALLIGSDLLSRARAGSQPSTHSA